MRASWPAGRALSMGERPGLPWCISPASQRSPGSPVCEISYTLWDAERVCPQSRPWTASSTRAR